ncbi:MAG: LLM class flavin-dependent oxidoreductase [Streptomyces sp.]|nr:LLM class flavin-dependent oxidoreductase [Streptomyces sp.]
MDPLRRRDAAGHRGPGVLRHQPHREGPRRDADRRDRGPLDIVSPEQVRTLRAKLDAAAERAGRTAPPTLASWLPAAVDPDPASLAQVLRSIAGYLTVPGYSGMFEAAGFGEAVELARTGADSDTLVRALPAAAAAMVGLVGDLDAVRARAEQYAEAGLDEIALVPATAGDPGGGADATGAQAGLMFWLKAQAGLMLWLKRKTLSGS